MESEPENLLEALYIALDRLEALDSNVVEEPWFQLIQRTADAAMRPDWVNIDDEPKH